jgi:hypothetical protein
VVGEHVDVRERVASQLHRLERHLRERADGGAEGLRPLHPDPPAALEPDQLRPRAVRVQRDRPDRPVHSRGGGRDHPGAGAVGEQRQRVAVLAVEEAREEVGPDHQRMAGAARLDLAAGHRHRPEPAGAGGADVERARAASADQLRDQRCRVRGDLVRAGGGHQHQIELGGSDAGALERSPPGAGGEIAEALAGLGPRPFAGAGALDDPLGLDAEQPRDLLVADAALGHGHRHGRQHRRALGLGPRRSALVVLRGRRRLLCRAHCRAESTKRLARTAGGRGQGPSARAPWASGKRPQAPRKRSE